jgi:hypothetical protein
MNKGDGIFPSLPDFNATSGPGLPGVGSSGMTTGLTPLATGFLPGASAPPENPYLQAVAGNVSSVGNTQPDFGLRPIPGPTPNAPTSAPAWLTPTQPEPSRLAPLVPDNLKPSGDSKYFPQLKRF